jgi:hypothetical protein
MTTKVHEDFSIKSIGKSIKKTGKKVTKDVDKGVKKTSKGIESIADAGLGGIMKAINEIIKVVNKMDKFFKSAEDFFKQWAKGLTFLKDPKNAMAMLFTVTIPILGQLFARIVLLNGSMDKPWLFLFSIPPLTFVPALAIMFSYVEKLDGGVPWDNIVWLPLILNVIGAALAKNHKSKNIFKFFLTIGGFMIAYWYKSTKICDKEGSAKTSKIALDSLISYMFVIVLSTVLPFIPYVGNVFSAIQSVIPYSDLFFQAFAVFLVYVGTNITNGSFPGHCSSSIKTDDLYLVLIAAVALTVITAFSPGDVTSMLISMQGNASMSLSMQGKM